MPSIDTRSIETQVLVNNGQTVVLGGIYETEQSGNSDQGAVPSAIFQFLGVIFKSKRVMSAKIGTTDIRNAKNTKRRLEHLLRIGRSVFTAEGYMV